MKNIIDICKEFGIEIPEDKSADLSKAVAENYLTRAEHEKKLEKVGGERDKWKKQAETAQETLKGFEGVDLQTIQNDLATWKKKAEDAEKDYSEKLAARDFEDALKAEMAEVEFTSTSAKNAVMEEIRKAGLRVRDGKIVGLSDVLESIRKADASAFVDKQQRELEGSKAKFTTRMSDGKAEPMTRDQIMKIRDATERQRAIAENIELFRKD